MCGSMADIQSPTAEIRRGNKKEEERNSMKIYMVSLLHRATINKICYDMPAIFLRWQRSKLSSKLIYKHIRPILVSVKNCTTYFSHISHDKLHITGNITRAVQLRLQLYACAQSDVSKSGAVWPQWQSDRSINQREQIYQRAKCRQRTRGA